MRRGTTPTITLVVKNRSGLPLDLTDQEDYYLTFKQVGSSSATVEKEDPTVEVDGDDTRMTVEFTQEETLRFRPESTVEVQLRSKKLGQAIATTIASFKAERILKEGVI